MAIMAIIDRFSKHLQTSPNSGVDFPRITEICQRVADRPDEVCRVCQLWGKGLSRWAVTSTVVVGALSRLSIA